MRLAVSVLTCFALSATTAALADPATTEPSATPAAAPATPAPATAAAPAAAHPAAPAAADHASVEISAAQMDQLEKHFLSEGYKIEMRNGEKYFCRREEQLGSRLGGQKQCSTAQQLDFQEKDAQRAAEHARSNQASSPK
jgi:hypothetical protein